MESLSAIKAGEIMSSPAAYVMSDTPLMGIADFLLDPKISAFSVLDEAALLVGIVSEGDPVSRGPDRKNGRRSWWLDLFEDGAPHSDGLDNYLQRHGLRAKDVMPREVVSVAEDTSRGDRRAAGSSQDQEGPLRTHRQTDRDRQPSQSAIPAGGASEAGAARRS